MTGFNIACAVNGVSERICKAKIVRSIAENPIFTALLITALVVIVIMAQYYYKIKKEGNTKLAKTVLYIFLLVTAVMFLHNYASEKLIKSTFDQQGLRDMFSSIQQTRDTNLYNSVPVIPSSYMPAAVSAPTQAQDFAQAPAYAPTYAPAPAQEPVYVQEELLTTV